ncbi:MAG: hypothetical protein P1U58_01135 [Verrucomicrobiales bacterium]|nr:hypothetical protein [Verrucomicrobiales bacterium]
MKFALPTIIICMVVLLFSGLSAYDSPDFAAAERVLRNVHDREALTNTELGASLIELAINLQNQDEPIRRRALALAWIIGSEEDRSKVIAADFYLRLGRVPPNDEFLVENPSSKSARAAVLKCSEICSALINDSEEQGISELVKDLLAGMSPDLLADLEIDISPEGARDANFVWLKIDPDDSGSSPIAAAVPKLSVGEDMEEKKSFVSPQSSVNGLLVMEIEGSEFAGGASKMVATVTRDEGSSRASKIRFNQSVGPMMSGALSVVEEFLELKHGGIPRGREVSIGFDERTSMKDGPSAAVACALLLESLITGSPLDQTFAVTGDMSADGTVQPVGGIDGKIRGALKAGCTHVAIPKENIKSVNDIFLLEGIASVCKIQIFSISDFDQALRLAADAKSRDPQLIEAMALFNEIADVVKKPGSEKMVSHPSAVERLRRVLELAPNHASAELLLRKALGSAPTHLSLAGSFIALDRCIKPMIAVRESRDFASKAEPLKDSIINLRRMRTQLDPRTKDVSDNIEDLYEALSSIEPGMPATSPRLKLALEQLTQASDRLDAAYATLRANPEVQEELNM